MKRRLRLINFILMFVMCFGALGFMPRVVEAALPTDLFISEYIEGSGYYKAIEIYNGTGVSIDLSSYSLELYSNGSPTVSQTLSLNLGLPLLSNNDVLVLVHGSAVQELKDLADVINSTVINFNGDDAVVLRKGGIVLDVFGVIGTDPGTAWTGGGLSTADRTLVRKATVCSGDPIGSDAFDPSVQWEGYPTNTISNIGSHTASCAPADTAPTVTGTSPADGATKVAPRQ